MNDQVPVEMQLKIENLVHEYRQYKISVDSLQEDMKEVKDDLQPLLEEYGKYDDVDGYASIVTRNPSISYKSSEVEKLVRAWEQSGDAMLKSAAEMLKSHRSERDGYSYVRVK